MQIYHSRTHCHMPVIPAPQQEDWTSKMNLDCTANSRSPLRCLVLAVCCITFEKSIYVLPSRKGAHEPRWDPIRNNVENNRYIYWGHLRVHVHLTHKQLHHGKSTSLGACLFFFFFFFFFFLVFLERVYVCSPGCPGKNFLDQAGL